MPREETSEMIITQHVDNRRSGANIGETGLRPNNVNANRFGRVFELPVMGAIYAQPLVAPGIRVGGRLRNVLFVATMHNMIYAFDAEAPGAPLWGPRRLGQSIPLPDPQIGPSGYKDIEWEVGIRSTPRHTAGRDVGRLNRARSTQQRGYSPTLDARSRHRR